MASDDDLVVDNKINDISAPNCYFPPVNDSIHFKDMLKERGIQRKWTDLTIESPDRIEDHEDGTRHYLKQISEFENRWLRVIVNRGSVPEKRITAFFDRRLRRAQ